VWHVVYWEIVEQKQLIYSEIKKERSRK